MVTKSRGSKEVEYFRWYSSGWFYKPYSQGYPTLSDLPVFPDPIVLNVLADAGTITYENGHQRFNPCNHATDKLTVYGNRSPMISWEPHDPIYGHWWVYTIDCDRAPTLPSNPLTYEVTEQMRARAWQAMYPKLNTGFSLLNFLWELKDFPRLLRTLARLKTLIGKFDPAVFGSRTAADLHLTIQFGIKPFVADIEQMVDLLSSFQKAIRDFKRRGETPDNYHYSEVIDLDTSDTYSSTGRTIHTYKGVYHATMKCTYSYTIPPFLEGWRRVWGLRLTPENIWNAIPFSFLVDWVWKVNKFLAQFDEDPNLVVSIIAYCDSVKSTSTDEYVRGGPELPMDRMVVGNTDPLWTWVRTQYTRTPGVPNTGYALPVFDSLSKRELVLGAALLRALL